LSSTASRTGVSLVALAVLGLLITPEVVAAPAGHGRPQTGYIVSASPGRGVTVRPTPSPPGSAGIRSAQGVVAVGGRHTMVPAAPVAPTATSVAAPSARPKATTPVTPPPRTAPVTPGTHLVRGVSLSPTDPFVTRVGAQFFLDGHLFRFVGINLPQAATDYDVNGGCGAAIDLPTFFDSRPMHTAVRVGFGQDAAINANTGARDWRGLDRLIRAAESSPSRPELIVGLTSQSGTCDASYWKDAAWYSGGYRLPASDAPDKLPRIAYWDYLQQVVSRYSGSPAIAMWEPVGEAEPSNCDSGYTGAACYGHTTCPATATSILRTFFDVVGAEVKTLDPNHLIGDGAIGGTQCGWGNGGSQAIDASPFIDAVTFHDYYGRSSPAVPSDLFSRIAGGVALGKPVISEEVGMAGGLAEGCTTLADRAEVLSAKERGGLAAGLQGFLLWAYGGPRLSGRLACDYYVMGDDPLMSSV
jgi:mannan endo-1,4-beta-mannosidase